MRLKAGIMIAIASLIFIGSECNRVLDSEILVVDGTIITQELPLKNTNKTFALFLLGKTQINYYDSDRLPDFEFDFRDTTGDFSEVDFPDFLSPVKDAQIKVNATSTLTEAFEGQYQGILDIQPGESIKVDIATYEGDTGKIYMVMPGSFELNFSDTVIPTSQLQPIHISWTSSRFAKGYMLTIYKVDTTKTDEDDDVVLMDFTTDTFYTIPDTIFDDGNDYLMFIGAVYGKFNASLPEAGDLIGIYGKVASAYVKYPVAIRIE